MILREIADGTTMAEIEVSRGFKNCPSLFSVLNNDVHFKVNLLPTLMLTFIHLNVTYHHSTCIMLQTALNFSLSLVLSLQALFKNENCPKIVNCEFVSSNTWYVNFDTENDALNGYNYLRQEVGNFKVCTTNFFFFPATKKKHCALYLHKRENRSWLASSPDP